MTINEIISAVLIHLLIPLTGLLFYLRLIKLIKKENIENPPTVDLFFIFSTYGGLLLVTLTVLFWKWSGLASLETYYFILGAPIVMGIIGYRNHKNKEFLFQLIKRLLQGTLDLPLLLLQKYTTTCVFYMHA